ncbi:MAG: cytochrome c oxidase assembly protein [Methyloprofundus sp.]|nr:cytochrome c oxidase assembly protein [Methyloprofundus sp.]
MSSDLEEKNKKTVRGLLVLVFLMFLFAAALIPLYDILCEITGINGKTKKDLSSLSYEIDSNRKVTLEFVTTVGARTRLAFKADQFEIKAHPGEKITARFTARNLTNKHITAKASPSFTPGVTAGYVKNIECFCFSNQVFKPGETKHLEVQLVVSPSLAIDYKQITFGLTFYDITH